VKNKTLTYLIFISVSILISYIALYKKTESQSEEAINNKNKLENDDLNRCEKYLEKLDSFNLSLEWKLMNCGLWHNKLGEIGFKTNRVICSDGLIIAETYITKFGFNENQPLKDIIDTLTFIELGNTYYKDKNHIYHHYSMSDGGSFNIFEKADLETFQIIGDCYAKDKNHIFEMRTGVLENVDYATFKTKKGLSGCVAKDKNGYIIWGERINKNEIKDDILTKAIEELDKE
jgi:hypothetical protein